MTIHDTASLALISASGKQWLEMLEDLLASATEHCQNSLAQRRRCNYWSDKLRVFNFRTTAKEDNVATPYGNNNAIVSVTANFCNAKYFGDKLTVRFRQEMQLDLPTGESRNRAELASSWLEQWRRICRLTAKDENSWLLAKGVKFLRSEVFVW